MSLVARFVVNMTPVPQSRPRFAKGGVYEDRKVTDYKTAIRMTARMAMLRDAPVEDAVALKLGFFFAPPKSTPKKKLDDFLGAWYTGRKDVDNLAKAVMDAMNEIVYDDDKQVVSLQCEKRYGIPARVEVEVERVAVALVAVE